jgi:arabinofuranosyltransferase
LYSLPGILFCLYFIYSGSFATPYGRQFTLSDTSMVSMTYAKTFVNSGELVWFPGAERVQGFSNFLYTIFFAFIHLLKLSNSINALLVSVVNLFILIAISYKVVELSRILNPKKIHTSYFLGSIVFFQYSLIFWSLRGYEVGMLALITISSIVKICRIIDRNRISIYPDLIVLWLYLSIGIWLTLDFIIIAVTLSTYIVFVFKKIVKSYKHLLIFQLGIFLSLFSILIFQYTYYGDFFPNILYLETGGFLLIEKIPRGIISSFKIYPLLLFQSFLLLKYFLEKSESRKLYLIFFLTSSLTVYNILMGGDNWEVYGFANRTLTLLIPIGLSTIALANKDKFFTSKKSINIIFSLLLVLGVFSLQLNLYNIQNITISQLTFSSFEMIYFFFSCLFITMLKIRKYLSYLLGIIFTIFLSFTHVNYLINTELQISSTEFLNTQIGIELRNFTSQDAKIGVLWAGNIGYYSERQMIDFLGKSDKFVAKSLPVRYLNSSQKYNFNDFDPGHNKWNFEYSIGILKPDIILRTWDDEDFYTQIEKNGYEQICVVFKHPFDSEELEIYIKNDSKKIIKEKIQFCSS